MPPGSADSADPPVGGTRRRTRRSHRARPIGKLSVPQTWMAKAPMNPAAVAALLGNSTQRHPGIGGCGRAGRINVRGNPRAAIRTMMPMPSGAPATAPPDVPGTGHAALSSRQCVTAPMFTSQRVNSARGAADVDLLG